MASLRDWIGAFRLRTLPLAAAAVLTGSALPVAEGGAAGLLGLALVTAFLLQVASNLANDLGDSRHGADHSGRVGPARAVQSGAISDRSMQSATRIALALAFLSGILLLCAAYRKHGDMWVVAGMLGLGVGALIAAYSYTAGPKPYGYRGLGDVAVFLFFGLTGVAGTFFLFSARMDVQIWLPSVWMGCQAVAVLHLNNMRDRESDSRAGKFTLAVRLGPVGSMRYHRALLAIPVIAMGGYAWAFDPWPVSLPALAWLAVAIPHLMRASRVAHPPELDPELKKIALGTFLCAVLFFAGHFLRPM